jgi:hypothetical protein
MQTVIGREPLAKIILLRGNQNLQYGKQKIKLSIGVKQ